MSHPALMNALKQITKKSSHPNALVYEMQKERAKRIYLPSSGGWRLGGKDREEALALGDGVDEGSKVEGIREEIKKEENGGADEFNERKKLKDEKIGEERGMK